MDPLFSHAPQPDGDSSATGASSPSHAYTVVLPAPRDVVYRALVGDIHLWWPVEETLFGDGTHVFVDEGVIGEEGPDGRVAVWGDIVDDVEGERLEFAWKRGGPDSALRVSAQLADSADGGTRVDLSAGDASVAAALLNRLAGFFGQAQDAVRER